MKTPFFERACTKLTYISLKDTKEFVRTNMGVSSKLRCTLPFVKTHYVFGRPANMLSERATLALVRELSRDCTHFVDVGANDGIFVLLVNQTATACRPQLHWFEPDRDLYSRLADNLASNGISARGNRVAVSDHKGVAVFHKNLSDDSSGSLLSCSTEKHNTRPEMVDTVTLQNYLNEWNIHGALIKIDVEGAGYEAWVGASGAADRITYMIIEMLAQEIDKCLPWKIMSDTGFRAYYIRDFELEEIRHGNYRYTPPFWNWLFCRLDALELSKRLAGTKFRVLGQDGEV
jgi:FkbM family methyltransferase